MKFSTAIKLGSLMAPQAFGMLWENGKTCAYGAAYMAIGLDVEHMDENVPISKYNPEWAWLEEKDRIYPCPECHAPHPIAVLVSFCLNDTHEWARPRIAEWIASIEPQEVSQPTVQVEEPVLAKATR